MDDENWIRKFVRLHAYKGRELSDVFNDYYGQFYGEYPNIGVSDLVHWFKYLRLDVDRTLPFESWYGYYLENWPSFQGPSALKYNPTIENNVIYLDNVPPQEFYLALRITFDEFSKLQRIYSHRKCSRNTDKHDCKMILLSDRYAVDAGDDTNDILSFYLVDILHNEKRELQINGDHSAIKSVSMLVALDAEYFLCHPVCDDDSNTENLVEIYLFKVDVAKMQCTLKDRHEFDDYIEQIIIDSTNPHKFLFSYQDSDYANYARKGRLIGGGKLEFDDEKINYNVLIPNRDVFMFSDSHKYADDKLYGLCRDQHNDELIIFEATFVKGKFHFLRQFNFAANKGPDYEYDQLVWTDNACYIFVHRYNEKDIMYKFDLDTQKMTKTEVPVYDKICCASQKNGIIIVCKLSHELQHAWHRLPLSQPDTLFNLTMDHLQQEAIFMDKKEHARFVQRLPTKLRPFGQSTATDK